MSGPVPPGYDDRRGTICPVPDPPPRPPDRDPVLARRAQMGRLARNGKWMGYSLWLVAIVVFTVAMVTTFRAMTTTVVVGCLAVGSALLAPSIVIAYGVRAADREERDG